jgi:hypothetical protein
MTKQYDRKIDIRTMNTVMKNSLCGDFSVFEKYAESHGTTMKEIFSKQLYAIQHPSQCSLWTRPLPELHSGREGIVISNVDFGVHFFKTDDLMMVEEKSHVDSKSPNRDPKKFRLSLSQMNFYRWFDTHLKGDEHWKDCWLLMFENLGPLDGRTYLRKMFGKDGDEYFPYKELTRDELILFWRNWKPYSPPLDLVRRAKELKQANGKK